MRIFLDTADVNELRQGALMGVVDGVTTNPSLVAKTGRPFKDVIKEIVEIIDGPISVESVALDAAGMIREGQNFAALHKNVVVKLPMTEDGVKATKALSSQGIKTNVTLIFTPLQAWLAAKAGATYVSPFIGRLDDISTDGMLLVRETIQIFKNYNYQTQVLAASIRHPVHMLDCAKAGAHVATLPLKVLQQLYQHPLTKSGLDKFIADWKASQGEVSAKV